MKIYKAPKQLLTTENSKTVKGEKLGYTTYIMYLSPHTQNSKGINLCKSASPGCAKACLHKSGAARFDQVQAGKLNKTEYFIDDINGFMAQLVDELTKIEAKHNAIVGDYKDIGTKGKKLYKNFAVRLNGTADIPFERIKLKGLNKTNIFELFPDVQFYDYTKRYDRFKNTIMPTNYHLTFSRSEINDVESVDMLNRGYNVAYVFGLNKTQAMPTTYNGFDVINGDESDLRFLDKPNTIVGLKYKLTTTKGSQGVNKDNLNNNDFLIDVRHLEGLLV